VIREFRIAAALVAFTNALAVSLYGVLLLLTFGFELGAGITLIGNAHRTGALTTIGYVLVASLIIGIFRAWELVADWNTGIASSIALLIGHKSKVGDVPGGARAEGPNSRRIDPPA